MKKYFYYFLIINLIYTFNLLASTNIFNIPEPKVPEITNISNTSSNKHSTSMKNINEKNNQTLYIYKVSLIFSDKTILTGITSFTKNRLRVSHIKKGFLFKKDITFDNIKSIKIEEWKPILITKKTNSKVLLYYFYPDKFKIITKNNEKFNYKGRVPFIDKLVLTNQDGSTEVYSYFADYWYITGNQKGYWKNSRTTLFYYPFRHPLKKVIKIIKFR